MPLQVVVDVTNPWPGEFSKFNKDGCELLPTDAENQHAKDTTYPKDQDAAVGRVPAESNVTTVKDVDLTVSGLDINGELT